MTKPPPTNRLINDADDEPPAATPYTDHGSPPPSATRTPKSKGGKGAYPLRRQLTAYVEPSLFLRLKSISALTEKPMIEIMEEALSAYAQTFAAQRTFSQSPRSE